MIPHSNSHTDRVGNPPIFRSSDAAKKIGSKRMRKKPGEKQSIESRQTEFYQPDLSVELLKMLISEGIRQAKSSANQANLCFSIAIAMATASAAVGLGGAGLLLFGMVSEGSATTALGLASGVFSRQLSKDATDRQKQANDRLDQMLLELQKLEE